MQEDTQYENTEENTVSFIPPASLEQEIQQEIEEKRQASKFYYPTFFKNGYGQMAFAAFGFFLGLIVLIACYDANYIFASIEWFMQNSQYDANAIAALADQYASLWWVESIKRASFSPAMMTTAYFSWFALAKADTPYSIRERKIREYKKELLENDTERSQLEINLVDKTYGELHNIIDAVYAEYAQIESDDTVLITAPAIKDINVPATKRFHEAFYKVNNNYDAIMTQDKDKTASKEDNLIVHQLEKAWRDALFYARSIGLNGVSERDKGLARKVLERVLHPVNEHELKLDKQLLEKILKDVHYDDSDGYETYLDAHLVMQPSEIRFAAIEKGYNAKPVLQLEA